MTNDDRSLAHPRCPRANTDDANWVLENRIGTNARWLWLRFNDVTAPTMAGWLADTATDTRHLLEADRGPYLGFARVVATRV